ncbi:MAG: spore germination protein [Syntrophomonadaceae bacterium]|nr:spore germination protein [Syntrophomonadaceae bacterium]HAA09338.1 spore germination protein [Syntrophomonas sp.]HQA51198.1 spore germination protein [Syntrophomonadaceae bacterium]HQD91604.1 spore germination protein [Syntrophomonadaceae bacterium]
MRDKGEHLYLSRNYTDNLDLFKQELGEGESFDIIVREMRVMGRKAAFICIDGFVKDDIITLVMKTLLNLSGEEFGSATLKTVLERTIPYVELSTEEQIDELIYLVMAGAILLIVDGCDQAFVIDARTYPSRNPEEPDIERVVRGSRDGFTETLVFNTALIRRRIRDPKLRVKLVNIGRRSKTDICLLYLKDVADPALVDEITKRIEAIEIDAVPMAEKSVEEMITPGNWWNPFPRVRYTERPDVAAVHLLEGHILIMVDTSPSVIIAPSTYFHHIHHAEEYRQNPAVGVYIRWIRFLAILISIFITPLWLLVALEPDLLPASLKFIGPEKTGEIPLLLQFLIGEVALDFMRMAAIHTPSPLATALGVIAALLIGEVATNIGLLIPEVILYTAVVAVGSFSTPSYELSMANRLVRLFLLLAAGLFQLPGFLAALALVIILVSLTKSFGIPYLWPLIPFNWPALKAILIRSPVPIQNRRPSILNTRDRWRQPAPALKRRRP